ncbi:unnamed protein product [Amoebophrya sp. A120]|nr:unnamed protein product [Amoebophrya sp. A120]|eukprot:GSA120T00016437001.1
MMVVSSLCSLLLDLRHRSIKYSKDFLSLFVRKAQCQFLSQNVVQRREKRVLNSSTIEPSFGAIATKLHGETRKTSSSALLKKALLTSALFPWGGGAPGASALTNGEKAFETKVDGENTAISEDTARAAKYELRGAANKQLYPRKEEDNEGDANAVPDTSFVQVGWGHDTFKKEMHKLQREFFTEIENLKEKIKTKITHIIHEHQKHGNTRNTKDADSQVVHEEEEHTECEWQDGVQPTVESGIQSPASANTAPRAPDGDYEPDFYGRSRTTYGGSTLVAGNTHNAHANRPRQRGHKIDPERKAIADMLKSKSLGTIKEAVGLARQKGFIFITDDLFKLAHRVGHRNKQEEARFHTLLQKFEHGKL